MFKGVVRSNSAGAAPAPNDDYDDDNISLTSTVPDVHDPETQFVVDDVLCEERDDVTGEMRYLILWEGFGLNDCTWEPEDNLGPELKAMWEEKKKKFAAGEKKPFDMNLYHQAMWKARVDKAERHRRRNAKRQRKGLPLTPPFDVEQDQSSAEESEAIEESTTEPATKEAPAKAATASAKTTPRKADKTEKRPEVRRQSIPKVATGGNDSAVKKPVPTSPSSSKKISDRRPSTGYQGTARKLSASSGSVDNAAGKVKTAVSIQGASSSSAGKAGGTTRDSALKAKKTVQKKVATASTNIFAGGKTRNPRTNLVQAMSDPSKGQKMFDTHRQRRLAEKRGRDKEDLPIALETIIPVNGKVPSRASSHEALSPSPLTPVARTASLELKSALAPRDDAPPKKKRKSVRWVEDEDNQKPLVEEPEQMDIDPPETAMFPKPISQSRHSRLKSPPPPPGNDNNSPGRLSVDQHPTEVVLTSLEKRVTMGSSPQFTVVFDGVPQDPAQEWISDFTTLDLIEFRHTCFSKNIKARIGDLFKPHLIDGTVNVAINGTITSPVSDTDSKLEVMAQYLRAGLLGLYCSRGQWNIVVYPTRCEEWKEVWAGQEPATPSGAALCYTAFFTGVDYRPFLRPSLDASSLLAEIPQGVSGRRILMGRLHNMDYDKLLPKYSKLPAAHGFFLAFPQSREGSMLSLQHWLRDCNPHCHIYSSTQPGAWAAFWANASDKHFRGAVIVHEMLVPSLFRFPMLSGHLIRTYEEYWCYSEAAQPQPIYQSIHPLAGPEEPGRFGFHHLFPARTVICVTPSFLVSEPQRACEFFEWFLEKSKNGHYYRLVTAWNIHEYLMELATEKTKDWEGLRRKPIPSHEIAMEANLRRLGEENCEYRYRTAALALELYSKRIMNTALYGLQDFEDESDPLIFANPLIDPNDEQSLVNWFGWWSTMRVDQFRKFHVLGSSPNMTISQRKIGERRIRLPSYTRGTVNDPDAVLKAIQEREMVLDQPVKPIGDDLHEQQPSNQTATLSRKLSNPFAFPSNMISNERDIHPMLKHLQNTHRTPNRPVHWVLNIFPVSWIDFRMADHFSDLQRTFTRIPEWFKFPYPFGDKRAPYFTTYIGFFYTIVGEWDPETTPRPSAQHVPQRHPWLVFYRPVNPHQDKYNKECEVIIWDPSANERVSGSRNPTEKDLLDMQRKTIQHVRENTAKKNPDSQIEHVWLGGFEPAEEGESPYPFDRTVAFLERALENLSDKIPPTHNGLLRKGFRKVVTDDDVPMDIDDSSSEEDNELESEDLRIIFHPPRATQLPPGQRTQCTNKLYEEARLARQRAQGARGRAVAEIRYSFASTEEWYAEQRKEGRSFEHINVQSWENIFNLFKIGMSKAVVEGATADEGSGGSPASS